MEIFLALHCTDKDIFKKVEFTFSFPQMTPSVCDVSVMETSDAADAHASFGFVVTGGKRVAQELCLMYGHLKSSVT